VARRRRGRRPDAGPGVVSNAKARVAAGLELEDEDVRDVVTLAVDLDDPAMPTIEVCACSRGGGPCGYHWSRMDTRERDMWRRKLGVHGRR
jgi:hypothetical protein